MDTSIYTPYFYIIQHIESGKIYAGVKYAGDANPVNLLKSNGYQTSSSIVKQIILEEGLESFTIRKIRIFETGEEALDYESRFLKRVNAAFNDNFLNRSNNSINGVNIDWVKLRKTNLSRYGCEIAAKNETIKEKNKKTCLVNLGCEYPMQSEEVRNKSKQTILEKYGVSHYSQTPEFQEKNKKTCLEKFGVEFSFQSEEVRNKGKETLMKAFGVENSMQSEIVKEKSKETLMNNFGVENPMQSEEIREKYKQNFLRNHGVEHPSQVPEFKEKSKNTFLKKYGVTNPSQVPEIEEKKKQTRIKMINRPTVLEIRNYRDKFKLKLGHSWYWKPQEILDGILAELKTTYGEISENM